MKETISELEQIAVNTRQAFGGLSPGQINWKPSAESWSVGQCFEHLIKANSAFFSQFESIIRGEKKQTTWESYSPLSSFFGNLLLKSVSPEGKRKLKAPPPAVPSASNISPSIIADFAKHQSELIEKIRLMESFDSNRIILTSPFIRVITYSLFDAYRITIAHEKRHFAQAERVVQSVGFPRSE